MCSILRLIFLKLIKGGCKMEVLKTFFGWSLLSSIWVCECTKLPTVELGKTNRRIPRNQPSPDKTFSVGRNISMSCHWTDFFFFLTLRMGKFLGLHYLIHCVARTGKTWLLLVTKHFPGTHLTWNMRILEQIFRRSLDWKWSVATAEPWSYIVRFIFVWLFEKLSVQD